MTKTSIDLHQRGTFEERERERDREERNVMEITVFC